MLCLLTLLGETALSADGVYESVPIKPREVQMLSAIGDHEIVAGSRGILYTHPELSDLVDRVGARVSPTPTDPYLEYRFHIVLSPRPEAFSMPDGQVYITVGMLAQLENEAQLAMVLAHEISHAAGHHGIRRHRRNRKEAVGWAPVWITLGILFQEDVGFGAPNSDPYEIYLGPAIRGYRAELEEEADQRAVQRVAEAGYDVRECARLYEILAGKAVDGIETKWGESTNRLSLRASRVRRVAAEIGQESILDRLDSAAEDYRDLQWRVALDSVSRYLAFEELGNAQVLAEALVEEREDDEEARRALAEVHRAREARWELFAPIPAPARLGKRGPQLPAPNPDSGSIALTLRAKAPVHFGTRMSAVRVFFVRLGEDRGAFAARELISSSFTSRGQVYLLNAKPGRYVAVAVAFAGGETRTYVTGRTAYGRPTGPYVRTSVGRTGFFPVTMISGTEVTVLPQEISFMGEYQAKMSTRMKKADVAQAHYYRLLMPHLDKMPLPGLTRVLAAEGAYLVHLESLARDPETESEFWTTARDEVFEGDPRWRARVARQLVRMSETQFLPEFWF